MLVLTRKAGQSIVIGKVKIKVLSLGQRRIRLGIEAPRRIVIMRTEILERRNGRKPNDQKSS